MGARSQRLGVTELFAQLGRLFVEGRLRELTEFWSFPCPVEVGGSLMVMANPGAMASFFAARRAAAAEAGIIGFVPRIVAIELPRRDRFRVWLRWSFVYPDRIEQEEQASVYYLVRRPDGALLIEMMDIVPIPADVAFTLDAGAVPQGSRQV